MNNLRILQKENIGLNIKCEDEGSSLDSYLTSYGGELVLSPKQNENKRKRECDARSSLQHQDDKNLKIFKRRNTIYGKGDISENAKITFLQSFNRDNKQNKFNYGSLDSRISERRSPKQTMDGIINRLSEGCQYPFGYRFMHQNRQKNEQSDEGEQKIMTKTAQNFTTKKSKKMEKRHVSGNVFELKSNRGDIQDGYSASPQKITSLYFNQTFHKSSDYSQIPKNKYRNVAAKILTYENHYAKVIKQQCQESEENTNPQLTIDNLMAVKVDRTMPVIFASSLNYKSINSEQTSPKDTSFKRHNMKKNQRLVRSVAKYIEAERQSIQVSSYDKSFIRIKGTMIKSSNNTAGNDSPPPIDLQSKEEKPKIKFIGLLEEQELAQERIKKNDKNKTKPSHSPKMRIPVNQYNERRNSIISYQSDDSANSNEREYQNMEMDLKNKVSQGIMKAKAKKDSITIKKKYICSEKAQDFIQRQKIVDWTNIHQRNEIQSVVKFKKNLQDLKSMRETHSKSHIYPHPEVQVDDEDTNKDEKTEFTLKSQNIMKRVTDSAKQYQQQHQNKLRQSVSKTLPRDNSQNSIQ